jgi:hypothetical protein
VFTEISRYFGLLQRTQKILLDEIIHSNNQGEILEVLKTYNYDAKALPRHLNVDELLKFGTQLKAASDITSATSTKTVNSKASVPSSNPQKLIQPQTNSNTTPSYINPINNNNASLVTTPGYKRKLQINFETTSNSDLTSRLPVTTFSNQTETPLAFDSSTSNKSNPCDGDIIVIPTPSFSSPHQTATSTSLTADPSSPKNENKSSFFSTKKSPEKTNVDIVDLTETEAPGKPKTKKQKTLPDLLSPKQKKSEVSSEDSKETPELNESQNMNTTQSLSQKNSNKIGNSKPDIDIKKVPIRQAKFSAKKQKTKHDSSSQENEKSIASPKSKKSQKNKTTNQQLTMEDNNKTGRRGEEIVYLKLKSEYQQKYPNCKLIDSSEGFTLEGSDNKLEPLSLTVIWHNKNGEMGRSYDITIIKNGQRRHIEVKTTTSDTKDIIHITQKELEKMGKYNTNYRIFRVYDPYKNPQITKIKDPAKKIESGEIKIIGYEAKL